MILDPVMLPSDLKTTTTLKFTILLKKKTNQKILLDVKVLKIMLRCNQKNRMYLKITSVSNRQIMSNILGSLMKVLGLLYQFQILLKVSLKYFQVELLMLESTKTQRMKKMNHMMRENSHALRESEDFKSDSVSYKNIF